jgi:sarcosine oxidase subunit delta
MLRIACPYCGTRDHEEFSYFGDATQPYPDLGVQHRAAWVQTVYTRPNPRGVHSEFWQHTLGCRRWLVVKRHTVTHDIESVLPAAQRTLPRTRPHQPKAASSACPAVAV